MTSVFEGASQGPPLNAGLLAGLRELSNEQAIPFTQYIRHVMPLDGYVFWLRTQSTMIRGSLHYAADKQQHEDETISISRVVFTTGDEVQQFSEIGPDTMWIGEVAGLKFAFSHRGPFYQSAQIYHYGGDAVYPALESQLVEVGSQLTDQTLIVSNSLPAWLSLKSYAPIWLNPSNPTVTLYPSFAVPDNLQPPYGAVHIASENTRAIQSIPNFDAHTTHTQLASDRVRITLYGLTNDQSLDFLDTVIQYISDNSGVLGLMNDPVMRDDKRTQSELGILAMKKTVDFEVSYYQTRINDIARQLIEQAIVTYLPQPYAAPQ